MKTELLYAIELYKSYRYLTHTDFFNYLEIKNISIPDIYKNEIRFHEDLSQIIKEKNLLIEKGIFKSNEIEIVKVIRKTSISFLRGGYLPGELK